MTVEELRDRLNYWMSCGWDSDEIYDSYGDLVMDLDIVQNYPMGDPANPNCEYKTILMLK